MSERPGILFTAFEPSGDEHAAPVIAELRRLIDPAVPIWALGGPKMAEAGATLIENTTANAAMLSGSLGKISEQLKLRKRFRGWLDQHPIAVHVPTDSPAANWALCKMVKQRWATEKVSGFEFRVSSPGETTPAPQLETRNSKLETPLGRVVHLVCPQVWAWASWRVKRLQRWSDLVLCILPFEVDWLAAHNVRARFIGHPLFDHTLDEEQMRWQAVSFGGGRPRIALLPGSRPGEVAANWPLMRSVLETLRSRYGRIEAIVAAADDSTRDRLEASDLPLHTKVVVGQTDAVLAWSDLVLTVSGTATLHVARHLKPMVIVYRINPASWHAVGRWVVDTRTFTLPNLIACNGPDRSPQRHIVREFVPWLGGSNVSPIVAELSSLIENPAKRQAQVEALRRVVAKFDGHCAGKEAAEAIAEMIAPAPGPGVNPLMY